jgi:protein SCO1/2
MKCKPLWLLVAVFIISIVSYIVGLTDNKPTKLSSSLELRPAPAGGEFSLNSSDGIVKLSDFKDKLVFLYFGYTYCPDICLTNLSNLSIAFNQLTANEQQNVQIVFISVDPTRDTAVRLQEYLKYYEMNAVGLTGTKTEIDIIARNYGFVYNLNLTDGEQYSVDHSSFTYVINKQGKLLKQLPHATSPSVFISNIRQVLSEK